MNRDDLLDLISKRSVIDTFAGCGGSALGLRQAGWHGLFAVEKDPMAFDSLSKNFLEPDSPFPHFEDWPTWLPKKHFRIEEVLEEYRSQLESLRGQVSMIIGGPPCQGFSVGGARNGTDERNDLVFKLIELVELVRPPFVIIENVTGIARVFESRPGHHEKSVAEAARENLSEIGYSTGLLIVNAQDYGVPQSRARVIIIGVLSELSDGLDLDIAFAECLKQAAFNLKNELGLPLDRPVNVAEALTDLGEGEIIDSPEFPKFKTTCYVAPKSTYAKLMREGTEGIIIPDSHRHAYHGEKVASLYSLAHKTQKPGRLSKTFLLENGTKSNKKFLLDPDKPSSTLTTHPDEFIHYLKPRIITVREMARLQSFPDLFKFYGRYTLNGERRKFDVSRCAQVGNAIPPLLARALGQALIDLGSVLRDFPQKRVYVREERPVQLALL